MPKPAVVVETSSKTSFADFTLPATGGVDFKLYPIRSKSLVVYFYPKDDTPGCTSEAQQFRDLYEEFHEAGSEIVGISRDNIPSHEKFKSKFTLPFALLSDVDETVCNLFGVMKQKTLYGKPVRSIERSTFVLDSKGVILKEWRGLKADGHADEVLDFIETIQRTT
jgi:thioredoxin-dependent peroxiredoxin